MDIRVAALYLILGTLVLVPGLTALDRSAAAASSPAVEVVEPVEVVPVEAAALVETAEAASALTVFDTAAWSETALGGLGVDVFGRALNAARTAISRGEAEATTLTVIDFSRPSVEPRMWVYDLRTRELLFHEHVSHGRNSGHNLSTSFSNVAESNKSSLGLFRTAEGYFGKHGYSLRLDGLERGVNDRARARAIVIHGAAYVNAATAAAQGRLGRSLGCPAVRPEISRQLIDAIKGGGLLFAYYPDEQWLSSSSYLN